MRYTHSHINIVFALLVISFSLGCSAELYNSVSDNSCTEEHNLPELVLVGTDVQDISNFKSSSEALGSEYSTEMGGATLAISIESSAEHKIINRIYQEPGAESVSQIYLSTCITSEYIYSENLTIKIVEGGILVFEPKPKTDGIPDSLWVFYKLM